MLAHDPRGSLLSRCTKLGIVVSLLGFASVSGWTRISQYQPDSPDAALKQNHGNMPPEDSPKQAEAALGTIAERVRTRFSQNPYLRVSAKITHEDRPLSIHAQMSKDKLLVVAFRDGRCVAALSSVNRRTQEYAPNGQIGPSESAKNVLVEYDAPPDDVGMGRVSSPLLIDHNLACEFGSCTESWLSRTREQTHVDFIADVIQNSSEVHASIQGNRSVWTCEQTVDTPQRTVKHRVIIDQVTADVLRWDTTQITKNPQRTTTRTREYLRTVHADSDAGWEWRIDLKKLSDERNFAAPE